MKLTKEMKVVIEKLTKKAGEANLDKEDIDMVLSRGKVATMVPRKNEEAKGGLILVEGNLTLNKVKKIVERLAEPMHDEAYVFWGAVFKKDLKRTKEA